MSARSWPLVAVLVLSSLGNASAQSSQDVGSHVSLTLKNGDILSGVLVEVRDDAVVLDHTHLGRVRVPRVSIQPPPPPEPKPTEPASTWSGNVDFAVDGSRGNNQNTSFRASLDMRREDDDSIDTFGLLWNQQTSEVEVTSGSPAVTRTTTQKSADSILLRARREWLFEDSPWGVFLQGQVERDDFKDWDTRVAAHTGARYQFLKDQDEALAGRVGLGLSREYGGLQEETVAEVLLGADYRLALGDDRRLSAALDLFPSIDDAGEYRSIADLNYNFLIRPEDPWSAKIGLQHIYDSDPAAGTTSSDLNYYLGLSYGF